MHKKRMKPSAQLLQASYQKTLKINLKLEQYKLYDLIWKRTVACQMISATIDTVAVDLSCGKGNRFRANGSTIANPGFISVYQEGHDDKKTDDGGWKNITSC